MAKMPLVNVGQIKTEVKIKSIFGQIMVMWSHLELETQWLLWNLCDADSRNIRILTSHQGMDRWLTNIENLIDLRYTCLDARSDWKEVKSAIHRAKDERNMLTHSFLGHTIEDITFIGQYNRKTGELKRAQRDHESLGKLLDDIIFAKKLLLSWHQHYLLPPVGSSGTRLPPLPDI
jgi:hypothetical protein